MQDIQIIYIIVLLITGIAVGFASGLLGVGGCFIMVPVQLWVLTSMGLDPTIATRVAFGTSLAVVLPTAFSGCHGHSCLGAVLWRPGVILGISGMAGAFIGGSIAAHLPGDVLKLIFGLAVLAGALRMLLAGKIRPGQSRDSTFYYVLWGFPLGFVSGLSGIGGGVLMVPAMVVAMGFTMHQAVGTSSLGIAFNALGGILSYALNGWGAPGLPPYSIGYIDLLQLALLAGTSIPMAQVGAKFAHRLPGEQLRFVFIVLMLYVSLNMIGVFQWLHLPL